MNQTSFLAEMYFKQRQNDLLKETAAYHLAAEAVKGRENHVSEKSKFLVWVGKKLQYVGFALEEHYGEQFIVNTPQYHKTSQSDCA